MGEGERVSLVLLYAEIIELARDTILFRGRHHQSKVDHGLLQVEVSSS